MKIVKLFEQFTIDLSQTLTLSTNNGGVVTIEIYDALLFIEETQIREELEFLNHLATSKDKPSQASITSFLKHLFFDAALARLFVQWQRSHKAA